MTEVNEIVDNLVNVFTVIDYLTIIHEDCTVGKFLDEICVVGNHHNGNSVGFSYCLQGVGYIPQGNRVQITERFIQKQIPPDNS